MNYNTYFILNYSYDSWLYKKRLLEFLIENYEELAKIPSFPKFVEIKDKIKKPMKSKSVIHSLKIEYFASTLHITEALFALLWGFQKDINKLWVNLFEYRLGNDLAPYVEEVIKGNKFSDDDINFLFYGNANLSEIKKRDPKAYKKMKESIETIKLYLPDLAKWFIQHKKFYNSYKHGLRFIRGDISPIVVPDEFSEWFKNGDMESIIFPEEDKNGLKPKITLLRYDKVKRIYKINYKLIWNMFYTLRQLYKIQKGEKLGSIAVNMFDKKEIEDLFFLMEVKAKVTFKDKD